jgi:NADH dehydrogenase
VTLLLCGGTGALGGAVARRLADRGVRFRALVRPTTDPGPLAGLTVEIVRGDLRDPATLIEALAGISTVVTTANAIGRILRGAHDLSIRGVDDLGNANLVASAAAAGVERFVFVSILEDHARARTPFTDAKVATERRLRESSLREVIVRPDSFQEVWLGRGGGFDLAAGRAEIAGKGLTRRRYVAIDDVADAIVRLALAADPPTTVELAGPEAISPVEAVRAYEQSIGRPLQITRRPRLALRVGSRLLRRYRPATASKLGMALASDVSTTAVDDGGFRGLGIEPRPASAYIAAAGARARG